MTTDRARLLFEASPTATLMLTREGTVAELNQAARKTFAMGPDRMVGRPILATVVPDDRDRVRELFLRVLQGQRREWTTRFKRGDAATRVQWVRAIPLDGDGGVQGILMHTRDITDSREGRPETLQLQTLLENLPGQFTAVLDVEGRIRYSSGLSRTHFRNDIDAVGLPYTELLERRGELEEPMSALLETVRGGGHWAGMHWHRRVDGTSFPVRTFASPYLEPRSGRVLGVLLAGRDLGAEHKWRQRAERAQRLASVGEFVSDVAARIDVGVAHLRETLAGSPIGTDAAVELRRLGALAGSIADFASPGSATHQRVSLADVAEEALARLAVKIGPSGVSVQVDAPEGAAEVMGDRDQLTRVVAALVENAVEEAAPSGAGVVRISFASGSTGGVLRVANSGGADAAEALHRAFEPFFSTKEGRAGLGLTMARSVVQSHGGRIWSEVDAEGWVVFSIHLPSDGMEAAKRFRPTPLQLSRTRTVLIVDDEAAVRSGIRRFLEKVGFEVREAWSGRSALAQITAGEPPEIVLTDLRMSDGSGHWFVDQLSRDFPDLLSRTVIVTGDPDADDVAELVHTTGCPVLSKPLEFPHLLELLDEVSVRG
jgi:PAS domain S-box-containing protein